MFSSIPPTFALAFLVIFEPGDSINIKEYFGIAQSGTVVQREIELTAAPADLQIEKVVSSCGCAVATYKREEGSSKRIAVKWTIPQQSGRVSKHIQILGISKLKPILIDLEIQADAHYLLSFEKASAYWQADSNAPSADSLILNVFNYIEEINSKSQKAFIELDKFSSAVNHSEILAIPITEIPKEKLPIGAFQGWALELSSTILKKIPSHERSVGVVFETLNSRGDSQQVICDLTVRQGAKLLTRIVQQDATSEIIVDLFIRLPPAQWNWDQLRVCDAVSDRILDFQVEKKSDYYGRIVIGFGNEPRPKKVKLALNGDLSIGSTILELPK
jgi:hypothetical protein